MTPEGNARAFARSLTAGFGTFRAAAAAPPAAEGITVQVHVSENTIMSDENIKTLARKIGRKLLRDDDDGPAGALVPA